MTSGTALQRIEGTVFHGLTCVADEGKADSTKIRKAVRETNKEENDKPVKIRPSVHGVDTGGARASSVANCIPA